MKSRTRIRIKVIRIRNFSYLQASQWSNQLQLFSRWGLSTATGRASAATCYHWPAIRANCYCWSSSEPKCYYLSTLQHYAATGPQKKQNAADRPLTQNNVTGRITKQKCCLCEQVKQESTFVSERLIFISFCFLNLVSKPRSWFALWPKGTYLLAEFRIHDILVWIRIRGSMSLTNGSPTKNYFKKKVFRLITVWWYIYIIFQR